MTPYPTCLIKFFTHSALLTGQESDQNQNFIVQFLGVLSNCVHGGKAAPFLGGWTGSFTWLLLRAKQQTQNGIDRTKHFIRFFALSEMFTKS